MEKLLYGSEFAHSGGRPLEETAVALLKEKGLHVATAESCTGGLLSKRITEISGASDVFECGVISYSNEIKHEILGVCRQTLDSYGAVSYPVAAQMARGALKVAHSDIAVSITGIAGPNSDNTSKKVGLVYVGLYDKNGDVCVRELNIQAPDKDKIRQYNRYFSSSVALEMIVDYINGALKMQPYEEFISNFR